MASKLKITSRSAGTIRHAGAAFRSVGPDAIAKALEAQEVVSSENVHGAPISLHALGRELETRVRSTGGRPSLERATKIQKIPLRPEDWTKLEELAAQLSRQGVSATAGQVASVIVHKQPEILESSAAPRGRASRRLTRPATGS
jgi:hypothetical protein